jgi:hypothetical protein
LQDLQLKMLSRIEMMHQDQRLLSHHKEISDIRTRSLLVLVQKLENIKICNCSFPSNSSNPSLTTAKYSSIVVSITSQQHSFQNTSTDYNSGTLSSDWYFIKKHLIKAHPLIL